MHLGGLEVVGASRPADARRDDDALAFLRQAFAKGAPVTTLLRLLGDGFGPHEFGLESALPDAAEQIVESAAAALSDRFAQAYTRLFQDHQHTLVALSRAGYQLPPELRAPGELALARRLVQEIVQQQGSLDPADYATAVQVAREGRASGLVIDTPAARATVKRLLEGAVAAAIESVDESERVDAALAVLRIAAELDLHVDIAGAQELVYDAVRGGQRPDLVGLASALRLARSP
jgi:hypothetical protein